MYLPKSQFFEHFYCPLLVGRPLSFPLYPTLIYLIVGIVLPTRCLSQDVEQSIQDVKARFQDPMTYSGNIGIQLAAYQSNMEIDRSAPFSGTVTAGLNIGVLGIQTPLSFIYSSGGTAFNVALPSFGFAGISPSYRDYTLHLGDRSLELGKYSFSNHSFRGVGAEINKDKWYSRAFFGRLQRAQINDYQGFQNVNPLLRRVGWGALVGYTPNSRSNIEFSLFKGWDDAKSIPIALIDSSFSLYAGENVILSTAIKQAIAEKINLEINYSTSGFTERQDLKDHLSVNAFKDFLGILEVNKSTRWNHALEAELQVQTGIGQLSFTYEKIDPGYRTLGALFFQDDQENVTAGIATQWLGNKLSLIANGGIQRNNLADNKADQYRRLIGSIYTNFRASEKLSINLGFSNFSAVNRQVRILDPNNPNTLTELALANLNLNGGAQLRLSEAHQIATNFSYQKNQTVTTSDQVLEQMNDIKNFIILYNNIWKSIGIFSSVQLFYNHFSMPQLRQKQQGIGFSTSKSFKKQKLRSIVGISYSRNEQDNLLVQTRSTGNLFQSRIGLAWQIRPHHNIQADGVVLSNAGKNINSFFESRFNLRYAITLQSDRK
ncbi:MAG: hypothetical protein IPL46_13320 [Saprospiraceae bacterium]|nr:hypothetical protein [Saprospiraceae bacterium]